MNSFIFYDIARRLKAKDDDIDSVKEIVARHKADVFLRYASKDAIEKLYLRTMVYKDHQSHDLERFHEWRTETIIADKHEYFSAIRESMKNNGLSDDVIDNVLLELELKKPIKEEE